MTTALLALMLLAGGRGAPSPGCALRDDQVESFIKKQAARDGGEEYCQYRQYAVEDVDVDGKADLVVLFGIEGAAGGGNHVEYYLACFPSRERSRPTVTKIGERGKRVYESVVVREGLIVVEFKDWQPSDPMCCPTGSSKSSFSLKGGGFREQSVVE